MIELGKDDPRERLTDFITTGDEFPAQKTMVTCREQIELYYAYLNLAREPGLEFFKEEAETDMQICMSIGKPGKPRSEQVVEMFKSIDEQDKLDVGLRPITDYNRRKRKEDR